MCELIQESADDSVTQDAARVAIATFGHGAREPREQAKAVWWFVKHVIRFRLDEPFVREMFGRPDTLEFLISPALMFRSQQREGDCDDFTMAICALLECCGIGWEILTVAANPREPGTFSHVYPRAVLPDGSRLPLDASHGKFPGWQVPRAHVSRVQCWNSDGEMVDDAGSNVWDGLHGYAMRRGLGQTCGECTEYDDADNCLDYDYSDCTTPTSTGGSGGCPDGLTMLAGQCVVPGTTLSTANPTGSSCPSGLVMLAGTCVIPGTTVTSSTAGGVNTTPGSSTLASAIQSLVSQALTQGAAVANTAVGPTVPIGSVNVPVSSLLLYGGLAVLALFAITAIAKK